MPVSSASLAARGATVLMASVLAWRQAQRDEDAEHHRREQPDMSRPAEKPGVLGPRRHEVAHDWLP
jgi:hypothetical protein